MDTQVSCAVIDGVFMRVGRHGTVGGHVCVVGSARYVYDTIGGSRQWYTIGAQLKAVDDPALCVALSAAFGNIPPLVRQPLLRATDGL